jgi:hypothetical protein
MTTSFGASGARRRDVTGSISGAEAWGGAIYDFTHWPVLGIYVPASLTPEMVPGLFGEWEAICHARGAHFASLDMRDFDPVSAKGPTRRIAAREVERGMPVYRTSLLGVVRLVEHPLSRALLTAFDWMVPLPWPVHNTACPRDAAAWLRARARMNDIEIPHALDPDTLRTRYRAHAIETAS